MTAEEAEFETGTEPAERRVLHERAEWSTAYVNDLPDSAFLYVEPGGDKDGEGKTVPRSLRHFPYRDASGNVDLPHLRNALSRIPQSSLPSDVKDRLTAKAQRILEKAQTARAEPGRMLIERKFSAEFVAGDGRTVDVRVVPYGVAANVSDDGGRTFYREEWQPGCFDDQLVAGHRLKVLLNFEHRGGISDVVGKGVALRSEPDGLHGTFRMSQTQDGDKALELINGGILDSVSLEAYAKRSVRTAEGVVRRVKAHLQNVALCRVPAFADAKVLAVRERAEVIWDEDLLPTDLDAGTVERCRRLGIRLPQRYEEAHLAESGTPDDSGTPEDDTRLETDNNTPEE